MAGHDLIDRYLEGLRGRIRWRRDAAEIIDELRDHLYSAMDSADARSADEEIAEQRRLLERFGDERQVATALATTPRGGVAVPTASTKAVGLLAMVTAGLWLVFPIAWVSVAAADANADLDWLGRVIFMAGTLGLIAAAGLTIAVMVGLRERLGGLGALVTVGMVFTGLITGSVVFAIGLVSLGRWMHGEEPVAVEPAKPALPV